MTNQKKKLKRKRKPELKETVPQKRTQLYSDFFAIRPPLSQGETDSTRKGIVDKKFDLREIRPIESQIIFKRTAICAVASTESEYLNLLLKSCQLLV